MDKLDEIFSMQQTFTNTAIMTETDNPIKFPLFQREQLSAIAKAMIHESVEFDASIPWKWWKKDPKYHVWNQQLTREELIDVFHFVVAAAIFLGMSPDEMVSEYRRKHAINMARSRGGY